MVEVLFPNGISEGDEFRKAHAEATLKHWHQSTNQHTFKCVDSETGEIVGMGLGDTVFRERSEEERRNTGISWLKGKEKEKAEKILTPLWDVRERLWAGRRHICELTSCLFLYTWLFFLANHFLDCHVIAVSPKHQGRKAGAALVQCGIDLGEQPGLPVYFEPSPSTVGLYQKMGSERLKESVIYKAKLLSTESDIEVPISVTGGVRGIQLLARIVHDEEQEFIYNEVSSKHK